MDDFGLWDFRSDEEKALCSRFMSDGYVIEKANQKHLDIVKKFIYDAANEFIFKKKIAVNSKQYHLEEFHTFMDGPESNDLRLSVINNISRNIKFNHHYYLAAQKIIYQLCGNELAMQKRIGLSINFPHNKNDVLPMHADTWNGVSPYELNIWTPLVNCTNSMCLYILKKDTYLKLREDKSLLKLNTDDMYEKVKDNLTWITIKYGDVLAFDQSIPHGFALNQENSSHWSLNCRFKGLHTPYWDKKLGEYFMPITLKTCTRVGIDYKHPAN
ncbi:sporadic carbohydrate cluster 2OG-Fe(II) oxygenase [Synechococcus sp. KORDI-100]|uniref:sporadic carbohydrate cluster 2OG-Fe(II) oxygenase n=1 Tax=Synechococcus sp. KORDI-100 TaxID=1280380 RepID=UPI000570D3AD|nr:sporadic carbohydrate cluster 2OG-Fe(II) oxygenase [Synechococcus sp. KORDI-100]